MTSGHLCQPSFEYRYITRTHHDAIIYDIPSLSKSQGNIQASVRDNMTLVAHSTSRAVSQLGDAVHDFSDSSSRGT